MTTQTMTTGRLGWLIGGVLVLGAGCGRQLDDEREGFGTLGADSDGDELGEAPGSGGEPSESCFDGELQPGELCQVQAPEPLAAGVDPCSLSVGDLDGDGRLDLAVPNSNFWLSEGGTHVANVLRGYGNGGFAATEPYPAGEALPVGLAIGDFDGDGRTDLATANNDAQQAVWLRNLGPGPGPIDFAAPAGAGVGGVASSAAAGDLDADGRADLVVTTPTGLAILRGTADGLDLLDTVELGATAMHAEVADLDADGRLDLAVAVRSEGGQPGRLVLLHGGGDGSFPEQVDHALPGDPWWVRAGDLDMDGDLDLAVADYTVDTVSLRLGNALGGFSDPTALAVCDGPQSVAIGDLNNDGANDLAVGCIDADLVQLWIQVEGGAFELRRWFATGPRPVSVQLADLNGDGALDLAWANQYGNSVGLALTQP